MMLSYCFFLYLIRYSLVCKTRLKLSLSRGRVITVTDEPEIISNESQTYL